MKVLLLNPPFRQKAAGRYEKYFVRAGSRWPYSEYKRTEEPSIYRPFPFFMAYSAAVLKEHGFEVSVIDGVALQSHVEEFFRDAVSASPDLVAVEVAPFSIYEDIELARKIKQSRKDAKIIAVGPFVKLLTGRLISEKGFDWCIKGEYEFALLEIAESIRAGKQCAAKGVIDLNLQGAYDDGSCTDLIDPLDRLPRPAYEIFPSNDKPDLTVYWDVFCQLWPAAQMHSSRGCPYKCYFCLWNQVLYRNGKYRTFSTARVADEMEYVINKFGVREIYFDDDDFTISRKHVIDLCEEINKRALKIKWSCMADAINLDAEMITHMAGSGCIGIKFGVESADEEVLKGVKKPVNLQKVAEVVKLCAQNGIRTHATFSFGLLGESKESMERTLDYASRLAADSVQFSIATPYPGTEFYDTLKQKNMLSDFDWLHYDGSCTCVIRYDNLGHEQVEKVYGKAYSKWLSRRLFSLSWIGRQVVFFGRLICTSRIEYIGNFLKRLVRRFF